VGGDSINASDKPIRPAILVLMNTAYPDMQTWSQGEWLTESESTRYKGFTVTLAKVVKYTGLQVSQNPGLPVIYTGFGLMLAGLLLSFYVIHKTIRVRISSSGKATEVIIGMASRSDPSVFDGDLERINRALA
jgi:cytochrome c biogenesis protein ResB